MTHFAHMRVHNINLRAQFFWGKINVNEHMSPYAAAGVCCREYWNIDFALLASSITTFLLHHVTHYVTHYPCYYYGDTFEQLHHTWWCPVSVAVKKREEWFCWRKFFQICFPPFDPHNVLVPHMFEHQSSIIIGEYITRGEKCYAHAVLYAKSKVCRFVNTPIASLPM